MSGDIIDKCIASRIIEIFQGFFMKLNYKSYWFSVNEEPIKAKSADYWFLKLINDKPLNNYYLDL